MKKILNTKVILKYLYDQLTGNFMGFLIGMSASGLVSQFFETRSIRNLWGLTAKKTVVNKETFSNLEWIISILIGFVVFEIVTRVLKEHAGRYYPVYKQKFYRWVVANKVQDKISRTISFADNKRIVFFTAVNTSVKRVLKK
jgi:hypothetical protein